jgi:hypothetical protein
MQSVRSAAPLVASLLVVILACAWLDALGNNPLSLAGKVVALVGLAGFVYSAVRITRDRSDRGDPYDLSRLWDKPPPEPEEPERESYEDDLVHCHRCGASMPAHVGVCLECGNRLGY